MYMSENITIEMCDEMTNSSAIIDEGSCVIDTVDSITQEAEIIPPVVESPPKVENVIKSSLAIPKIVFIVPYRNREKHLAFFKNHMKTILEKYNPDDYAIYYIHQCDNRPFNRGAMKNIGFIFIKQRYPQDYKNITLVFNDVDSMPSEQGMIHYETLPRNVKHFFGFKNTLGGIVSIKAGDFEYINGFPNFWAWGYEDNLLQQRVEKANMKIDRNIFFPIGDQRIIQLNDSPLREVNQSEFNRYIRNTNEGVYSIYHLNYSLDETSGFVNVQWFETGQTPDIHKYRMHHLKDGPAPYDTKFGLMYNNRRIVRGAKMSMKM